MSRAVLLLLLLLLRNFPIPSAPSAAVTAQIRNLPCHQRRPGGVLFLVTQTVCLLCRRLAVGAAFEASARWKYQPLRRLEGLETGPVEALDPIAALWDNPTMIVTLDAKRRVSIPAALAPAAPGDQFDASFDAEEDTVTLRRIKRKADWLKVWKQCPVRMDDLPARSRALPKKLKL